MRNEENYMQISRQVLEQNAKTVVDYVKVPVIGVVKYDGCGVGIEEAARAWQKAGVGMFAVSESREAFALRQAGFAEDILLMAPVADAEELEELLARNIILTISDLENARFYLDETALPVAEIAPLVGFIDSKTFCRVFKDMTGTSPGQYRRRTDA